IASYLDMRLETISRTMHELQAEGCLRAARRRIELLPRIRAAVRVG
ncbi:MAG: winged helix-turn-helix domain-containing protein, partial [Gammaproteobacteria bacterium]|nr:winged helix-turn-helix domain-containing protein [Gammaproteobacteria bacterium]